MRKRMFFLYFTVILLFLGTLCNLYNILNGEKFETYKPLYGSRSLKITINEKRGTIYDRNLEPLVGNNYEYAALVDPLSLNEQSRKLLQTYTDEDAEELDKKIQKGKPFRTDILQPITGGGITSIQRISRYAEHNPAQNLIGYVDADGHGACGIEALFDDYLYSDESAYAAVFSSDGTRRALSGVGVSFEGSPTFPEYGVVLTLDKRIQKIAEKAADDLVESGVVLVQEIQTGDVVAMVSRPTYDPYRIADYLDDENGAMRNKAFASFNSGSSFKIVITAAALESGIECDDDYVCTGVYDAGSNLIGCGEPNGHGKLNLREAFANSCNTYFCNLAQEIGPRRIMTMARGFGFGAPTEFWSGYRTEAGNLPAVDDLFAPAALSNFAIGQGELQVTPVQIMNMASVIANDGVWVRPRLVDGFIDESGNYEASASDKDRVRVVSAYTAKQIRDYMCETARSGTGVLAMPVLYGAGVKTSSAQTGIVKDGENVLHTWVTGYFPAEKPQYAICVLVENGKSGYASAAPVFRQIADKMIAGGFVADANQTEGETD